VIDARISHTYAKDSIASNKNSLFDMYVRFFRWATDRLKGRDGILCFVSNNGFLSGLAFDGFRKHLLEDFNAVYHLDLKGNARLTGESRRREGGNIFSDQIRVGVGITILIKSSRSPGRNLFYYSVDDYWKAEQKSQHLSSLQSMSDVPWRRLDPDNPRNWFAGKDDLFTSFMPLGDKATKLKRNEDAGAVFKLYSGGVKTNRDDIVYDYDHNILFDRITDVIEFYNSEVDRYKRSGNTKALDDFLKTDGIKWSESLKASLVRGRYAVPDPLRIRESLYRPFCKKILYYDPILIERTYRMDKMFPIRMADGPNLAICCTNELQIDFSCLMTNVLPCLHVGGRQGQCFSLYSYDEDGASRRENITDGTLQRFRQHYKDNSILKINIFYYIYGILHLPSYRDRFSDELKRSFPRVPLAAEFRVFSDAGKRLSDLHVGYENAQPWPLTWECAPTIPLSYRVEKMRLNKEKTSLALNETLTLDRIPSEVFNYRLGNRSALEWVVDQYQVSTDKRSGIKSDPNRKDDPEYIVRLVGQVVRVSVETSVSSTVFRPCSGLPVGKKIIPVKVSQILAGAFQSG
jgi:predicted helicase